MVSRLPRGRSSGGGCHDAQHEIHQALHAAGADPGRRDRTRRRGDAERRLHRYNLAEGDANEASQLEREYAEWQGVDYCVACTSGGYAIQLALRACGVEPGDRVLANAYTLAPVPGAIHNVGGVPVLVDIDSNYHIDMKDLEAKAKQTGARFLLLSHMRGHIADMDRLTEICDRLDICLIEDCAHTMGASWRNRKSGNFGRAAAFSTQTYKHMNSGEGGFLTTNDPVVAARAVVSSGSYMLYGRHGAIPAEEVFRDVRLHAPNYSGRMDHLRAVLLRAQLPALEDSVARWNVLYDRLASRFAAMEGRHPGAAAGGILCRLVNPVPC